jgi:two-component system phosphate regulon sensor histidine kinase PhoR
MIRHDFARRVALFLLGTGFVSLLVTAALLWQFDRLMMQRAEQDLRERVVRRSKVLSVINTWRPRTHSADPALDARELSAQGIAQGMDFSPFRPTGRYLIGWATPEGIGYRVLGTTRPGNLAQPENTAQPGNSAQAGDTAQQKAGRSWTLPRERGGPVTRGLEGGTGIVQWEPPDGTPVLAAYVPIAGTALVLVSVEPLSDLRKPLWRAGFWALGLGALSIALITALYAGLTAALQSRIAAAAERERAFIAAASDAIVMCGPDGTILSVNPASETMFGRPSQELVGSRFSALTAEGEQARRGMRQGPAPQSRLEVRLVRPDGSARTAELLLVRVNRPAGSAAAMFRDRTVEAQRESRDRLRHEQLQTIVDAIPQRIFLKDTQGRYELVNLAFAQGRGATVAEFIGKRAPETGLFSPEECDRIEELDRDAMQGNHIVDIPLLRVSAPGGGERAYRIVRIPLRDPAGRVERLVGVMDDLSDVEKAEREADQARRTLQMLIDSVPHFVFMRNLEGRYITVNRAFRDYHARLGWGDPLDPARPAFDTIAVSLGGDAREWHKRVLETRGPVVTPEATIREPGGSARTVHFIHCPVFDRDGRTIAIAGIATDITDLKRAQAELNHLFNFSPDIQAIADIDGFFKRVNPAFGQILGYSDAEIVSQPFGNFTHEEDRELWAHARPQFLAGDFVRYTSRYRRRDGEYRWIAWHGKREPSTGLIYVGGRDVTEERRRDMALAANEQRLRVLIDSLPVGIYEADRLGNAILVNGRFTAITGWKQGQAQARAWTDHLHLQDRARVLALGRRVAESARPVVTEFRFVRPDGSAVWVEANAVALRDAQGNATGYLGALMDLTQRKRAEAAQVQSYNLMGAVSRVQSRFIAETPPADIFRQALDDLLLITESRFGMIALARSDAAEPGMPPAGAWEAVLYRSRPGEPELPDAQARLLGCAEETLATGRPCAVATPAADPPPHTIVSLPVQHARRLMAVVVLAGCPQGYGEDLQRSLEPVLATYGAIAEAVRNEGRRRSAEQDITQKNQQLESIFANLAEGVVILERTGRIAQVNRLGRSMLDWAEIPPHAPADLTRILGFCEPDGTPVSNDRLALVRCMKEGQTIIGQQVKLMRPWGEVDLQVSAAPLFDPAGRVNGAVAILGDITELKRMDRLKSEFIATVSHEVRTPLAAMLGYAQLILDGDAGDVVPEQRQYLDIIANNTARLTQLIGNLLDIERIESGKIKLERKSLNISELLQDVEATFRLAAKQKGLTLSARIAPDLHVAGDPDSLNQVFANFLSNAVKYTREGTIRIEAEPKSGEVCVTVADTGIGMTQESLSKLFTKFYRADDDYARKAGGTGLGLVISRAIVAQHGGRIEISSAHGKGTEFRVYLPSTEASGAPRRAAPAARADHAG